MISSSAALMQAILEHPEDDTVRLVYADAIEDEQPNYAAFIRCQIELAKCPVEVRADRRWADLRYAFPQPWDTLRRRERELFAHDDLRPWDIPQGLEALYLDGCHSGRSDSATTIGILARGFVDTVICPFASWYGGIGPEIVRRQPVSQVRLSDREPGQMGDGTWYFYGNNEPADLARIRHAIPQPIRERMSEYKLSSERGFGFDTRDAALADF